LKSLCLKVASDNQHSFLLRKLYVGSFKVDNSAIIFE
jgi:hypothetical protein